MFRQLAVNHFGFKDDSEAVLKLVEGGYALISKETSVNYQIGEHNKGNVTYKSVKAINDDFTYTTWLMGKNSPISSTVSSFLSDMLQHGIYAKVNENWINLIKSEFVDRSHQIGPAPL